MEACNSILCGESNMALAGGILNLVAATAQYDTKYGNVIKDGKCFTFDDRANGSACRSRGCRDAETFIDADVMVIVFMLS